MKTAKLGKRVEIVLKDGRYWRHNMNLSTGSSDLTELKFDENGKCKYQHYPCVMEYDKDEIDLLLELQNRPQIA